MKPKLVLFSSSALVLVAVIYALISGRQSPASATPPFKGQIFQVRGQVLGVSPADKTLRIAHEEIPDYMPAMTMSLPVKDPALLKKVSTGDEVQFELRVTSDDSWIEHVDRIKLEAAIAQAPTRQGPSQNDREMECLRSGELVPDFKFTNQDGQLVHLADFRGKAVIVSFIYTRCPLPNFCPLISKNFGELKERLGKEFPNQFQLISISLDPEFDRPEVLKDYGARYGAEAKDWSLANMDADSLTFVAGLMGLYFEKQNGTISHDLRTALIGPDGRLVHLWKSNVWTPYEVQRRVREVLTGHPDVASR
jgi:protein SCO1